MADKLAGLYSERIHPGDKRVIDSLTAPKNWDFSNFRKTLIVCSIVGEANKSPYYIPASNIPETIHIGNMRKYIDELRRTSEQNGNEVSRTFMVDTKKSELVVGKKTKGEESKTSLDWSNKEGLVRVLHIHTHPVGAGFSGRDYTTFMADTEQMAMIMVLGESTFLALKNTATPNTITIKDVERRIKRLEDEFFPNEEITLEKIIEFNKMFCLESGLSLFIAQKGKDLAKRVPLI